jgi:hypothetical protein
MLGHSCIRVIYIYILWALFPHTPVKLVSSVQKNQLNDSNLPQHTNYVPRINETMRIIEHVVGLANQYSEILLVSAVQFPYFGSILRFYSRLFLHRGNIRFNIIIEIRPLSIRLTLFY